MTVQIVLEGESTFPAITLFQTSGSGETALDVGDIDSATWSRKVVGTGEIVNSREDVALSVTEIPFTLEQTGDDNTRFDTGRRRERHELTVEYAYTRAAVAGKTGRFRTEFLVIPIDRVVYAVLDPERRYLRKITAGFTDSDVLLPDELYDAEEEAGERIESRLGKRFWSSSNTVPRIIERIAELLGASYAVDFTHVALNEDVSKYAAQLRKEAESLLDELVKGKAGIQYPDGTWDSDYPATTTTNRGAKKGTRRNLSFDRSLPFHRQHAHDATSTDDELFGHDDRTARGSEYGE